MRIAPQLRGAQHQDHVQPVRERRLVPPDPDKKNAGPLPRTGDALPKDVLGDTAATFTSPQDWGVWILRQRGRISRHRRCNVAN